MTPNDSSTPPTSSMELAAQPAERPRFDQDELARATYLTVEEAAAYLRSPSAHAFYEWARVHGLPKCRMGRKILYLRRDLDDAVQGRPTRGRRGA